MFLFQPATIAIADILLFSQSLISDLGEQVEIIENSKVNQHIALL